MPSSKRSSVCEPLAAGDPVTDRTEIEVCADWVGLTTPTLMGMLYATLHAAKTSFRSSTIASGWLQGTDARSTRDCS